MAHRHRYDRDYGRFRVPSPTGGNRPPGYWDPGPYWTGPSAFTRHRPWGFGFGEGLERYGREYRRRRARPPAESPTYGAAGDRAVRRWARERGYRIGRPLRRRGWREDEPGPRRPRRGW